MDDKVTIVHQNPFGRVIAFDAHGNFTDRFKLFSDLIRNGMALARIRHRADKKKIREGGDVAEI